MREKKLTKIELFEELAKPDENGVSRWVGVDEFTGRYEFLRFGKGADWARGDKAFGRKYIIEKDKTRTPGNRIDAIRTNGFAVDNSYSSYIDPKIKKRIKGMRCEMCIRDRPQTG